MINLSAKKGFTMIEMAVVVSLVVIILTVSVANYRRGTKTAEAFLSGSQVATHARQMQSYAASVRTFRGEDQNNIWGIHFPSPSAGEVNSYILFNDIPDALGDFNGLKDDGEVFRIYTLPKHIAITDLMTKDPATNNLVPINHPVSVTFIPPWPKVVIKDAAGDTYDNVIVKMVDPSSDYPMAVEINFFGLIDTYKVNE